MNEDQSGRSGMGGGQGESQGRGALEKRSRGDKWKGLGERGLK